jgi:hypothetical protein
VKGRNRQIEKNQKKFQLATLIKKQPTDQRIQRYYLYCGHDGRPESNLCAMKIEQFVGFLMFVSCHAICQIKCLAKKSENIKILFICMPL